jgi:hypothetical protein
MTGVDPFEVYSADLDLPGDARAWMEAAKETPLIPLEEDEKAAAAQESALLGSLAVTASGLDEQSLRRGWASAHDCDDPILSARHAGRSGPACVRLGDGPPYMIVDALAHGVSSLLAFETARWAARMAREHLGLPGGVHGREQPRKGHYGAALMAETVARGLDG